MSPDNSNISSLFWDIGPSTHVDSPPIEKAQEVPQPVSNVSQNVASQMTILASTPEKNSTPLPDKKIDEVLSSTSVLPPEKVQENTSWVESHASTSTTFPQKTDDERFSHYLEKDMIYQSMLRIVDADRIRLRLAIRYMIVMFAIFLVVAWVVNNRIIMFGFSEFQFLSRLRDALFGVLGGLFSLTLWFGSEVWFRRKFLIFFLRLISIIFFASILSALYFPLW